MSVQYEATHYVFFINTWGNGVLALRDRELTFRFGLPILLDGWPSM